MIKKIKPYISGLPTEAHDKIDVSDYFARIYENVKKYKGGRITDAFCGGGRELVAFHELLQGDGKFVGIDADQRRIDDMLAKNDALAERGIHFTNACSKEEVTQGLLNDDIVVIRHTFPNPVRNWGLENMRSDYILCSAGIMFIQPSALRETLFQLTSLLNDGGTMDLIFSEERPDQINGENYYIHRPIDIIDHLSDTKLTVKHHPKLEDAPGRGFKWSVLEITKD